MRVLLPATVQAAIKASNIQQLFPEIDLGQQKVGIFGKLATLDTPLEDGDRVEIYRPVTCDPKDVKRKVKAATTEAEPA